MTDPTPNDRQRKLIQNTDGIYLVDAGAGTGKTFTVTRRYANILAQDGVEPDDILLITFTDNAATEMRERIVSHCDYEMRQLADAPIQTFHSLCHDILREYGVDAPTHLDIDDRITESTSIVSDDIVEEALFREFVDRFGDDHPEYADFLRVVRDRTNLLDLVNQLAAKGVFPTEDGWYRNGERYLDGDFEAFEELFDEVNRPRNGGRKQSALRKKLGRYGRNKCYLPDAPEKGELRGGRGTKQVPREVAERVFDDDREALKEFVHDVYYEYVEFALRRNYLNFGFLQLFAFVLLCEDHRVREEVSFEYAMVDEFQDSSEIQFKLALLLANTDNLCVVGDWKQSIYSFQYAAVENIQQFRERLTCFADELNEDAEDHERVGFPTDDVTDIALVENYRSTQDILDFSEHSLITPATSTDEIDEQAMRDRIVSLESNADRENSNIEAIQSDDEYESVLTKIQEIVGNEAYAVEPTEGEGKEVRKDSDELRAPRYEDVAVLTRTRDFGRELQQIADEYGLPMAYEGGVELFRTDEAKLLLAWLRILESDADRGWATVLERAGYGLDEVKHAVKRNEYPSDMLAFRDELASIDTIGGVVRRVFSKYGFDDAYADVLLETLQSAFDATTMTRGDLVQFIERGIEAGSTHEVNDSAGTNSVTVQTIHAAKGLEHPIVILANVNENRFPPTGVDATAITYEDPVGLRQRKQYAEAHGHPYVYDNWRVDVLRKCLPQEYDEERRLLYVAMTRAESHLVLSAGESPSGLFENLPIEPQRVEPDVAVDDSTQTEQAHLQISVSTRDGPEGYTPHTLMRDDVFEEVEEGEGIEFGSRTHAFAERYALGENVDLSNEDERNVRALIDSLDGELRVEEKAYLPLTVEGERVTISGIVDLLHVTPQTVEVIDYKTDRSRHARSEYRKQLSVYYHVVRECYPEREISASLFYTLDGVRDEVTPMSREEIEALVQGQEDG
ncbi:UvrD-helicase domain-containing protein [Halorussus litoreus]|uniref:UvrD-helicase domain-containing protein n=1 Tax=Halorussus litoreus TaxID=1710536 RepID=UPI000E2595B5|nr:ATP-dependent DNA helicase [Halorussus litoreus]